MSLRGLAAWFCQVKWTSAAACQKTPFAHASLHETPRDFSDAVAAEGRYFRFLFSLAPMQQIKASDTCRMVEHPTGVNKLLGCQGASGPCPTGDSMPDSFHTPCVCAKPWKRKTPCMGRGEVRCDLFSWFWWNHGLDVMQSSVRQLIFILI